MLSSSICLAVHPARLRSCWGAKRGWEKPGERPRGSAACPKSTEPGLLQLVRGASKAPSAQGFLGSSSARRWVPPSSKLPAGEQPAGALQGRLLQLQAAAGRAGMGEEASPGLVTTPEIRMWSRGGVCDGLVSRRGSLETLPNPSRSPTSTGTPPKLPARHPAVGLEVMDHLFGQHRELSSQTPLVWPMCNLANVPSITQPWKCATQP